jgi:hypothetical protein
MISDGMRGVFTVPMEERLARQVKLVRYIVDSLSTHNSYAFGYFFSELLNFANVVSWIDLNLDVRCMSHFSYRLETFSSWINFWEVLSSLMVLML